MKINEDINIQKKPKLERAGSENYIAKDKKKIKLKHDNRRNKVTEYKENPLKNEKSLKTENNINIKKTNKVKIISIKKVDIKTHVALEGYKPMTLQDVIKVPRKPTAD